MKNLYFKAGLSLLVLLLLASCSSDSDSNNNNTPSPQPSTENIWQMNDYHFSRRISTQNLSTYTNGKPFTLVNIESNLSNNNNNFKFCSLSILFNTHETGSYIVKIQNTLFTNDLLKYMNVRCTVTDGAGKGAIYESIDSSISASVTQADGKFIIDIPVVTLTKIFDDGLENAPTTMTFKCEKVR